VLVGEIVSLAAEGDQTRRFPMTGWQWRQSRRSASPRPDGCVPGEGAWSRLGRPSLAWGGTP
jgi:hypothetical protein